MTEGELAIKLAVLEDRQLQAKATTEAFSMQVLAKLDSISRDVSVLNDSHHRDIEALHERITAEKTAAHNDIWEAIRRHEDAAARIVASSTERWDAFARDMTLRIDANGARIDQGRLLTISSLTAALLALVTAATSIALHTVK